MTISGSERQAPPNYTLNGHETISPMSLYGAQPPPYSEVTGTKNESVAHPQRQGQTNPAMVSDGEAPLQGMSLPEAPPAYESAQSTSQ